MKLSVSSPRLPLIAGFALLSLLAASPAHAQKAGAAPKGTKPALAGLTPATPPASTTPVASTMEPAAPAAASSDAPAREEGTPDPQPKKATGWLFDGSLGLPKLKSNETSLAFDVNAGWVGQHWGFGAYASSYTYALQQDGTINQTAKSRFGLEARYLSGDVEDDVRYEVKLEANSGAFNTTYISVPTNLGDSSGFSTEQSTLNRFTALVGRHGHVNASLLYKVSLGLGLQTDTYFRSSASGTGGETNFSAASSARFVARGQVIHRTLPDTLLLRGSLEASSYQLRRMNLFAGGDTSDPAGFTVSEFRETDVSLRAFGDIEKLAFLGLMPGAFVGLDYIAISGDRSTSALVPIFGVGIVNATPKD